MSDFRERLWAAGYTLREVHRAVGCEEAHFHRVISGKQRPSVNLAQRIAEAVKGLIAWTEFFEPHDSLPPADAA